MNKATKKFLEGKATAFARFNADFPTPCETVPVPFFRENEIVSLYNNDVIRLCDTQFDGWHILHNTHGNGVSIQAERLLEYDAVTVIEDMTEIDLAIIQVQLDWLQGWTDHVQRELNGYTNRATYLNGVKDVLTSAIDFVGAVR